MQTPSLPSNEAERLAALKQLNILDTLPEQAYEDLALLAAQICETPIATITFIDSDRQWFKSKINLESEETPRGVSFCAHAILDPDELFIVNEALNDERFADNELVVGAPNIRFYAGAPLVTQNGEALGTICVIDKKPRTLDSAQQKALRALSRQVMAQLELRTNIIELEKAFETQRKLEIEVRESENRFDAFMSNTPAVAFMKDENGRYVYLNKTMERTFNIEREQLIGKNDFDWLPKETAVEVSENDRMVLDANRSVELLETVPTPEGTINYWLSLKFPFTDATNKRFVGGMAIDITERKNAQEQLEQSEERFRQLFENSSGFICTHDETGLILSINPAAARALRCSEAELIGSNMNEIMSPEARPAFDLYLKRISQNGSDEGLMQVRTKKDELRTWKYRNLLYQDTNRRYIIGYAQDITEMLEAQASLRSLSLTDDLTNLHNRRGFLTLVEQVLKIARRAGQKCLLLYADLDGLKQINDNHGHHEGSAMIIAAAQTLRKVFQRDSDILARIGGDEFVVFVNDIGENAEQAIAARLQTAVDDYNQSSRKLFKLSISVGLLPIVSKDETALEELMKQADELMYAQKKAKKAALATHPPESAIQA